MECAEERKPNKRALAKARTQHKLLEAAKKLFTSQPYEKVTMRTIAAEMEMSTGAIFANFNSKADIFAEIVVAEMRAQYQIVEAVARKGNGLRETLGSLFVHLYEREVEQLAFLRARFSVMWRWTGQDDLEVGEARRKATQAEVRLMGVVCRVLERAAKAGEILSDHNYCTLLWDLHHGNLRRLAEGHAIEHIMENLHEQLDLIILEH